MLKILWVRKECPECNRDEHQDDEKYNFNIFFAENSTEKAQASNNILKAALQKTKTMDLYDDDAFDDSDTIKSGSDFLTSVGDMAIDDSLTLSQNNKREKIGEHHSVKLLLE